MSPTPAVKHTPRPSRGRVANALDALVMLFSSIGLWRQQLRPEARVHGIVIEGGSAANIIPGRAVGRFMVRAMDAAYFEELQNRFRELAEAAALAAACELEITFSGPSLPIKHNETIGTAFRANLETAGRTDMGPDPTVGSTDMGNVSQRLPAIHPDLQICEDGIPGHSPAFRDAAAMPAADEATLLAATLIAQTAYDLLANPDLVAAAWREFNGAEHSTLSLGVTHVTHAPGAAGGPASPGSLIARFYDLDLLDDPGDLDLYLALAARTDGTILELGAGSGRIAVPLAAAGHRVTAVDLDREMLDRATARWNEAQRAGAPRKSKRRGKGADADEASGELQAVVGDMTSIRLEQRFDLVIIALNTLLQLGNADLQLAALRTVAAHLAPKGRAVIDVWLPAPEDLALYDGRVILEWQREDPETGDFVSKFASARYDAATAMVTLSQWFDAVRGPSGPVTRTCRIDRLRLVPAAELTHLATLAGLKVETLAGDYRMAPFGPGDERAILIGRLI